MKTEQEIRNAIETILETGEIKHLVINETQSLVTVLIEAPAMDAKAKKGLTRAIAKIVKVDFGYEGLKLSIDEHTTQAPVVNGMTKFITVTSGKGGVGKSTVSANIAVSLARLGMKVGIIDADIYGPSLPHLFNMQKPALQMNEDKKILPIMTPDGVAIMSTEFLTENDMPLMWRGPMLGRMLKHFFEDVYWSDDYDYIIVDLPPGTGDVPMSLTDFIPEAKAIVVTTPNKMASHIAIKSGLMAEHLGHDILGVIENMSYYTNPVNGNQEKIFGSGGGLTVAENLKTDLLAEIPIAQVNENTDSGIFAIHEENGIVYLGLANKIMKHFA